MTRISEFMRFATPEEKAQVYGRVIRAANREQNAAAEATTDEQLTCLPDEADPFFDDEPGSCFSCGAIAGVCPDYPDCPMGHESGEFDTRKEIAMAEETEEQRRRRIDKEYCEALGLPHEDDEVQEIDLNAALTRWRENVDMRYLLHSLFDGDIPEGVLEVLDKATESNLDELSFGIAMFCEALSPGSTEKIDEATVAERKTAAECVRESSIRRRAKNAVWHLSQMNERWAEDAGRLIAEEILAEPFVKPLDSDVHMGEN